jgi:hypothetical protein
MDRINAALLAAALEASRAIGDDLLKMSCFVSNWSEMKEISKERELETA